MKTAISAVIATVMLSGCISQKTTLTDNAGHQVHCDAWGFGVIGAPVAMASHHDCIKKAHAAGYQEFPASTAPAQ